MLCYRDRRFCISGTCIKWSSCSIAFTPEVQKAAEKWWKTFERPEEEVPIDIIQGQPSCYQGV